MRTPLGASSLGAFPAGDVLVVLQGRGVPTALVLEFHPSLLPGAQMSWLMRWLQKASRRVGRSVCEVLLARPGIWKDPPRGPRAVGVKAWPTGPGEQALRGWLGLCAVLGLGPVSTVPAWTLWQPYFGYPPHSCPECSLVWTQLKALPLMAHL